MTAPISFLDFVKDNDVDKVKELVNSGIDLNTSYVGVDFMSKYGFRNYTALACAIEFGHIEMVKMLVEAGALFYTGVGLSAFDTAIKYKQPTIYNYLKFQQRIKI